MPTLLAAVIVFFAIFTQSAAGFGMSLVAMPLLTPSFSVKFISPLIALVGILAKILILIKYRNSIDIKAVGRLTLASVLFVPAGVVALDYLNQNTTLFLLGLIVLLYAIYSLMKYSPPRLVNKNWALVFGAAAGLLGGAFNASGPAVVIYANAKRWEPAEFKSNLQGYALVNGLFVVISHWVKGNYTPEVMSMFWVTIPAIILGVGLGISMDRFLDAQRFRKLVLYLLVILGIRLMIA